MPGKTAPTLRKAHQPRPPRAKERAATAATATGVLCRPHRRCTQAMNPHLHLHRRRSLAAALAAFASA